MDLHIEKYVKKSKLAPEEDHPTNAMENLPREIALDILSRLPVTSLLQSRFVCRALQNLSFDRNLVNLHLSKAASRSPFLIFHCDYPIQNHLYFAELSHLNDNQERLHKIHTPFCASMPEFNVVGSCNGLLCLSDSLHHDAVLIIYNPFTREYMELPRSRTYETQKVLIGFGYHSGINEYKVVKIIYYRYEHMRRSDIQSEIQILSLSCNKWRSIGKMTYNLEKQSSNRGVILNGRLHWISLGKTRPRMRPGGYDNIIAFDLADEQFHELGKPGFVGRNHADHQLAVLGGCLSSVVYFFKEEKLEIWIMKEYNVEESWVIEYKIGAFFPRLLHQDFQRPYQIWRNNLRRRKVRVLCILKNGEILLEYKYGTLAAYDPESGKFREIIFHGMPSMFEAVVHMGSLTWIDIQNDE